MDWRTELNVKPSRNKITLSDKIFTIGSCFSDEMGQLLGENKFQVARPFGTVYNPISIHRLLSLGLNKGFPTEESFGQNEDVYFNYHFHSSFSSLNRKELEKRIEKSITESNEFLKTANTVVITFGTAFVYQLKSNGAIVANCHKMSSTLFEKRLLTQTEIIKSFEEAYSKLKSINLSVKIILTVSPVRHLKDTLELNSVSKSILRMACHTISEQHQDVEYFPAFEILVDDLRDYRFYKSDRLHPTEEAVEYIWQKFSGAYFDESTKKFVSEWQKIKSELTHRSFHPESDSHQKFLKSLLLKLENLESMVDVQTEIAETKSKIVNLKS
jgi:hypothetical protein